MQNFLKDFLTNNKEAILTEWMKRMQEEGDERVTKTVSETVYVNLSTEFVEVIFARMKKSNQEYTEKLEEFSERIVRLGWPLTYVSLGLTTLGRIIYSEIFNKELIPSEKVKEFATVYDQWMTPVLQEIIHAYTASWERTVSLQKIALQELSAPLIPVFEKISVMPLVGTIDTERAKLIMENLLSGVVKHRSEVVLIDITGVPVVDTMVAHHIIQAADAVRLVGAKCMLVGIRPEIAQTIVNLGINLNQVITTSTLRIGIEKALEMTNRKIVKMEA
ncbi:RsbR protein [Heyndrickxia shackletonii]|uniref:RsbR protein n=1 Tax=Heyndrickxia shackletonii TaxID=157838 RepID=A0A0Q3TAG6_9BACI|nr:STAS domain-containing protein [Heyndrickxia shackletonii]KQL51046.1 RsbR protein [Heyndrickxia shackletonii]NEZ00738.1 STAS domain-containing protein [Heyndrickxia shackletonii]